MRGLFEAKTGIARAKIPSNLDAFLIHLQNLFGKPATKTLEMAMKKEIIRRFDFPMWQNEELSELIREVKHVVQKAGK